MLEDGEEEEIVNNNGSLEVHFIAPNRSKLLFRSSDEASLLK